MTVTHDLNTGHARRSDRAPLRMTEKEFVQWCDSNTWAESVDGEVILLSPVDFGHARILSFLIRLIGDFAEARDLGEVVTESFQIRLASQKRRRSPDLIFISQARLPRVRGTHFEGGPDLVLEVMSSERQSRDRREKFIEYEKGGVLEYWIVDPLSKTVEAYTLGKTGKFEPIQELDGRLHSIVLKGFHLRSEWLWGSFQLSARC